MVPDDGPVGELLKGTGRHPWRPSHLHFIITADGYRSLVTEVFPSDDPYIDADAVFGVREKLVMEYVEQDNSSEIPPEIVDADKLEAPFYRVDFDFILAKE
jgi:protocatechuate 3,4-dioxygenase beta subunit